MVPLISLEGVVGKGTRNRSVVTAVASVQRSVFYPTPHPNIHFF